MKYLLSAAALVICFSPAVRAADEENPFKKAKVGDWVEYKMTTAAMGNNIDGTMRMTLTAKDDKEATMETTGKISFMGNEMNIPAQKQKIDLSKPFDPTAGANLPKGTDVKVEKGDTKEKVKAGGKEYETTWMKMKSSIMNQETEVKIWISKDVPLSGMVKMEMKSAFANVTMELTGTGSK
jgi:hypothetical protein